MKNWHSSTEGLCHYLQAFRRPQCVLVVSSGILNPLMQLLLTDCSHLMFDSYITVSSMCLEGLLPRENVFQVLLSELLFQVRGHLYWH